MSLSVVVPTWNEAATLPSLLESLRGADAPEEVLVVDGASDDGTAELAEGLGARVLAAPRGRGSQLARGGAAARGELLLFLHADMRLTDGALAALRRAYRAPELAASGMRQQIDHPGRIYRWIEAAADRRVRRGRIFGDSALGVRRDVYERAGGFGDEPLFEDVELSRRLRRTCRRSGASIRLVEGAVVLVSPRRWLADGAVRRTVENWLLRAAWGCGVDPARLARYYRAGGEARGGADSAGRARHGET